MSLWSTKEARPKQPDETTPRLPEFVTQAQDFYKGIVNPVATFEEAVTSFTRSISSDSRSKPGHAAFEWSNRNCQWAYTQAVETLCDSYFSQVNRRLQDPRDRALVMAQTEGSSTFIGVTNQPNAFFFGTLNTEFKRVVMPVSLILRREVDVIGADFQPSELHDLARYSTDVTKSETVEETAHRLLDLRAVLQSFTSAGSSICDISVPFPDFPAYDARAGSFVFPG